jgi:2-iminobutanoate/2-iminopropanoate deaminase
MSELIAPRVAGPYCPGLATGDWTCLCGQGGFDPQTGELVSDSIAGQTAHVFGNIKALLRAAGASLGDVVSCLVHLSDLGQFAEFNASYAKQFPGLLKPVRTTVGSGLAASMRVEVTAAARKPRRAAGAVKPPAGR